jgi:hypothetical protein
MGQHELRPVCQTPFPEGLDPKLRDKIIADWEMAYRKFQMKVEEIVEEAGGKDKLKLELLGENLMKDIVIRFI